MTAAATTKKGTPRHTDPYRDTAGRFLPGNPGGPGNPNVKEMARIRAAWRAANPDCIFETVAARLQANALGGHFPSLKLYLEYMMGKPDKSVDLDDLEVNEIYQAIKLHKARQAAHAAGVTLPLAPPPSGRPEVEWKRSAQPDRPAAAAVPPPGSAAHGKVLELARRLKAMGVSQSVEELVGLFGRPDHDAIDAHRRAAAVSKREPTAATPMSAAPPGPPPARR